MVSAAHRRLVVSAAFAVLSWALVGGAPVLAAAPAEQAGPQLPPAEYKPLPAGTRVTYDTWSYAVAKNDGYDITYKTDEGDWRNIYAVFGRHALGAYNTPQILNIEWTLDLDDKSRSALESLWPLKVGKKIVLDLKEEWSPEDDGSTGGFGYEIQMWTVTLEVVRTTFLDLNGLRYPTYVIREHTTSKNPFLSENIPTTQEYTETRWYDPESGLILKSVKDWTRGPKKGGQEEYSLVRVRFPQGTKTNVLAGTTATPSAPPPAGAGPDPRLAAEIARLKAEVKAEAEAKQKALAEMRGREAGELRRQREEQQRLSAQVARLLREVEEQRKAAKQAPAGQQGTVQQANLAKYSGIDFGRYYALVIGIGNYKYLPKLKTAVNDATVVAEVLRRDYGFEVTLLVDPSRDAIIDALDEFREKLDDTTNLLIYYAGHGWLDEEVDRGYWLPVDAKGNRRSKWVSNATISDTLKGLRAKHVMVVADSCFSGSLVRGAKVELRSGDYWQRMARKRTRVALTSGGLEPVADAGGGRHSPFAAAFIDALKANSSVMDGTKLFVQIRRPVMLGADQTPEYADVRSAGHEGGDFLFVRRR